MNWFALSLAAAGTQATQFAVIKGRARDIPPVVIVAWTNAVAFTAWLRETAAVAIDQGFVYYLLGVALSHSHREHGPGGKIPPQFMVGAMSLTQTALASLLEAELADAREALRAATAWNKLLLVHLNVLLLGYMLPAARSR